MSGHIKDYGRWTYGPAGDRYPMEEGDIWSVGPHILACGDLEKGAATKLLERFPQVGMLLVDPPWDAGNARSFRTKAADSRPVDFSQLLQHIIEIGKCIHGLCFIEMGNRNTPLVQQLVGQQGGRSLHEWDIVYYQKHPCKLLCITWSAPALFSPATDVRGLNDEDAFAWAISEGSAPGDVVLDLCMGRGLTARLCHTLGRRALGLELHPRRLAVAIDWLVTQGLPAEKIGRL